MSVLTRPARLGWMAGRSVLDLVLPPHCPACDTIVDAPGRFCTACFRRAALIVPPCCTRCGIGFTSTAAGGLSQTCPACIADPPAWRSGRAAFVYDEFSRRLVLPLKYGDRTENAAVLAGHMARAGRSLLGSGDLLVPVPVHRRRLFSRRYNQAALLAYAIGRLCDRPVLVDALARITHTPPLFGQSPSERRQVVANAIQVRPHRTDALLGRHVVLIDDVLTTGATAGACAQAMLRAGAASVDVLAAARTVREDSQDRGREPDEHA